MKKFLKWMTSDGWARDLWGNVHRVPFLEVPLETGSQSSRGIVGARGRSITGSEIPDLLPTDASITPDDGSNTCQGRLLDILSQWKEDEEGVFILTVSFDSRTASRLRERASSRAGTPATVEIVFSHMTKNGEPRST